MMKLFKYYYDGYKGREDLTPKVKSDALKMFTKGLSFVRKGRSRMNSGEYLVAKHVYEKASNVLGKAIDQMHERGGL